ncbi:MAG: CHAT domain-containing protein [Myxococcota bacterium]
MAGLVRRGILVLTVASGCGSSEAVQAMAECRTAFDARDYEAARTECTEAFEVHERKDAGAYAAKSSFLTGRLEEVPAWLERVEPGEQQAGIHYLLGSIELRQGELEAGLVHYRAASTGFQQARVWNKAAVAESRMAYLLWDAGQHTAAHEHYAAAVTVAERSGNPALMLEHRLSLSEFLRDVGAQRLSRQWLAHARAGVAPDDPLLHGRLLFQEGIHAELDHEWEAAAVAFEQALEHFEQAGGWFEARAASLNLVEDELRLGNTVKARQRLDAAAGFLVRDEDPDFVPSDNQRSSTAWYAARVELATSDPAAALQRVAEGLDGEVVPDWRWKLETIQARALSAQGHAERAEAVLRSAVATVEHLRGESSGHDFRSWTAQERREPYERLVARLLEGARIEEALEVYELARGRALVEALRAKDPQSLRVRSVAAWLETLSSRVEAWAQPGQATGPEHAASLSLPPGIAVVAHMVTPDETFQLTYDGQGWHSRSVGMGRDELRRVVERAMGQSPEAWAQLEQVLAPLPERLPAGMPVLIVTEPGLEGIPWAALRVAGQPLLVEHSLSLMPSLTSAVAWAQDEAGRANDGGGLVMADAKLDLPAARAAADTLGFQLGLPVVSGLEADRGALSAADLGLWHIAVHTGTDAQGAWLELADGRVYADEIAKWPAAPRHVVLAGCRSAFDDEPGFWGALPAAFVAAGSQRVVATLRSVDDADAAELLGRFHARGGAVDPVGALAQAQRELHAEGWSPERWSPYVVIGMPFVNRSGQDAYKPEEP